MWKYIITWTLTIFSQEPCPDRIDEFGRTSTNTCSVAHFKNEQKKLSKVFYNKDSAMIFFKSALHESKMNTQFFTTDRLSNVNLDSIQFKNND